MALSNNGRMGKKLKVGKTERYILGLTQWLKGESLIRVTLSEDALVTVSAPDINNGAIGFFVTGVDAGVSEVVVDYETPTRSDCAVLKIVVIDACQ